jgi:hypothetical protein
MRESPVQDPQLRQPGDDIGDVGEPVIDITPRFVNIEISAAGDNAVYRFKMSLPDLTCEFR